MIIRWNNFKEARKNVWGFNFKEDLVKQLSIGEYKEQTAWIHKMCFLKIVFECICVHFLLSVQGLGWSKMY